MTPKVLTESEMPPKVLTESDCNKIEAKLNKSVTEKISLSDIINSLADILNLLFTIRYLRLQLAAIASSEKEFSLEECPELRAAFDESTVA